MATQSRYAGRLNLVIKQGTTYDPSLTYKDADGNPMDLTGYSARMDIREEVSSPTTLFSLSTDDYLSIPAPLTGVIQFNIPSTITKTFTWESGVYDLELFTADTPPRVIELLYGSVRVIPEVTREAP